VAECHISRETIYGDGKARSGTLCSRYGENAAGAVSFWLPDIVYHCLQKTELSTAAIWTMTAVMPLLALITYGAVLCTTGRCHEGRWSVATSMLLGIRVLAPTMIGLGQTFARRWFQIWARFLCNNPRHNSVSHIRSDNAGIRPNNSSAVIGHHSTGRRKIDVRGATSRRNNCGMIAPYSYRKQTMGSRLAAKFAG
jgi:hypothetical protein